MSDRPLPVMRIQLVRKLASHLDGIDVSGYQDGDVLDLPRAQAELLIAERWALPYRGPSGEVRGTSMADERAVAADRAERRTQARRRDDRIRDEPHDSRAPLLNDTP